MIPPGSHLAMTMKQAAPFLVACLAFIQSTHAEEWTCGHAHTALLQAAPGGSEGRRHYAPNREMDIQHLLLDITPNFRQRSIAGTATLQFAPIAKPLSELRLDAVDLQISGVTSTEQVRAWHVSDDQLIVTFSAPIAADRKASVTIQYSATPQKGLYFRTPEMGYPAADEHLWTQGEPTESRHWFPAFDAPNEKFTSEVICHVPDGMTVLSNGRQIASDLDAATGLRAVRWLQDKPHVTYLIALVAGNLKAVEGKHGNLPIALYTPASQVGNAASTFKNTRDMLEFFEREIGVAYPWDKYFQVAVSDYHWGGMENTSLTVLNEGTLHPEEGFETLRDSDSLVAHELAHQWFGDLVTCKDWSHLWLNEGFATYYDALYQGHRHGRERLLYAMFQNAQGILGVTDDKIPIVHRGYDSPEEQFSFRAYPKGSWILHMLRHQLGADLYRKCIQTYLERHKFGVVETQDLMRVIEELSGRSFDAFFDQYVFHAQQPDLSLSYEWSEKEKMARIRVVQQQRVGQEVLLFRVPATLRFRGSFGVVDREIQISQKSEDFYVPLPQAPETVRFDPDYGLLAKVAFPLPDRMLLAQLDNADDVIGRLLALEQLASRQEASVVARLKKVLNDDAFYGVRLAASKALRKINSDAAREALTQSVNQADARVRSQVLQDILGPYREAHLGMALKTLSSEKNPDIQASLFRTLGAYSREESRARLLPALQTESYRGLLSAAALQALSALDDPAFIEPILAACKANDGRWPSSVLASGLSALAHVARTTESKTEVREYLLAHLDDRRLSVQRAAISGLGQLGDPRALPALSAFSTLKAGDPLRDLAEKSVQQLRLAKKPSVEFGDLRNELLSLQQENKDLRRDLETLRKKLDALVPAEPAARSKSKSNPKSR